MSWLSGAGAVLAAVLASAGFMLRPGRLRSAALLAALALAPILVLGDQWHSAQIVDLRHSPPRLAALIGVAVAVSVALAVAFRRWPRLLPVTIVAALPFRVPLHAGGSTANLLVPLYLVIAGGVLSTALRDSRREAAAPAAGVPRALDRALAIFVVLYAVQTLYSPSFSKSLQDVCFFFVPFALAYALLRDAIWDRRLLRVIAVVLVAEALAFVVVGSVEYASGSLFWNPQVIRSNEFHTYFRVNSVFWDPNIYGRFLALVIVIVTAALLWARQRRRFIQLTALIAVLWIGLVPTFSESSFIALLAGLTVLGALRWDWRWTLGALAVVAALGAVAVVAVGGFNPSRINAQSSGRAHLVSGGVKLFGKRPLWGWGAGSFARAYKEHAAPRKAPVSISHTEPVTVAAEQGLIGLAAYVALVVVALWTMGAGLARQRPAPVAGPDPPAATIWLARVAVLAAFVALLLHTMAYAGFFEDPITWVMLAAGASLASTPIRAAA